MVSRWIVPDEIHLSLHRQFGRGESILYRRPQVSLVEGMASRAEKLAGAGQESAGGLAVAAKVESQGDDSADVGKSEPSGVGVDAHRLQMTDVHEIGCRHALAGFERTLGNRTCHQVNIVA